MPAAATVQKNLRLSAEQAVLPDAAAGLEGKDQVAIVAEALRLRAAPMGEEDARLLAKAVALRSSNEPARRLEAAAALRDDVPGAAAAPRPSRPALGRVRVRADPGLTELVPDRQTTRPNVT